MTSNRTEGTKHQVKGSLKEQAGKLRGDRLQEAEGSAEKHAGRTQKEIGKATDS